MKSFSIIKIAAGLLGPALMVAPPLFWVVHEARKWHRGPA
jgi:hypothetical protein